MKLSVFFGLLLCILFQTPFVQSEEVSITGQYSFVDSQGKPFSDKDFEGKISLLSFFFTRCQGPCPALNAKIQLLANRFGGLPDVQIVSISIDGDFDTPQVLDQYAKRFPLTSQRKLLTAAPDKVQSFSENVFHFAADAKEEIHTTKVILLGKDRRLLQTFDSEESGFVERVVNRVNEERQK